MTTLTSSTSDLAGMPVLWVNRLLDRLTAQVGGKMADLYAGMKREDVVMEWSRMLAGYTPAEINRGINECSNRKFAPTLGEFKHFCRPALDPEYAWHEAQKGFIARERGHHGSWSHPAVWRAARGMAFDIRNSTYRAARVRWEMELRQEFEKGWGEGVPPVQERVEHRPTGTPMPAAIRELVNSMRGRVYP